MNTVVLYVMMIGYLQSGFLSDSTIHIDAVPFKTADRCIRNIEPVRKQLQDQGYIVKLLECQPKDLNK